MIGPVLGRGWHHRPVPGSHHSLIGVLARPLGLGLGVPALVAAIDPWRRPTEAPSLLIGAIVTVSGLAMLVRAGREIEAAGDDQLVTGGLFAHSRNPMQLAVLAMLAGLSMASRSPILGVYLIGAAIGLHLWIIGRVEPRAEEAFGPIWRTYRDAAPRWFPRPGSWVGRR